MFSRYSCMKETRIRNFPCTRAASVWIASKSCWAARGIIPAAAENTVELKPRRQARTCGAAARAYICSCPAVASRTPSNVKTSAVGGGRRAAVGPDPSAPWSTETLGRPSAAAPTSSTGRLSGGSRGSAGLMRTYARSGASSSAAILGARVRWWA
eukprot:scaffold69689_cov21-Tisochrysis_lutea.AAC.1